MKLKRTMFREYDVRGRVPEVFPDAVDELSDEGMRTLGRGFGTLAIRRGRDRVVVGHDLRTYSPRLRRVLRRGAGARPGCTSSTSAAASRRRCTSRRSTPTRRPA